MMMFTNRQPLVQKITPLTFLQ